MSLKCHRDHVLRIDASEGIEELAVIVEEQQSWKGSHSEFGETEGAIFAIETIHPQWRFSAALSLEFVQVLFEGLARSAPRGEEEDDFDGLGLFDRGFDDIACEEERAVSLVPLLAWRQEEEHRCQNDFHEYL